MTDKIGRDRVAVIIADESTNPEALKNTYKTFQDQGLQTYVDFETADPTLKYQYDFCKPAEHTIPGNAVTCSDAYSLGNLANALQRAHVTWAQKRGDDTFEQFETTVVTDLRRQQKQPALGLASMFLGANDLYSNPHRLLIEDERCQTKQAFALEVARQQPKNEWFVQPFEVQCQDGLKEKGVDSAQLLLSRLRDLQARSEETFRSRYVEFADFAKLTQLASDLAEVWGKLQISQVPKVDENTRYQVLAALQDIARSQLSYYKKAAHWDRGGLTDAENVREWLKSLQQALQVAFYARLPQVEVADFLAAATDKYANEEKDSVYLARGQVHLLSRAGIAAVRAGYQQEGAALIDQALELTKREFILWEDERRSIEAWYGRISQRLEAQQDLTKLLKDSGDELRPFAQEAFALSQQTYAQFAQEELSSEEPSAFDLTRFSAQQLELQLKFSDYQTLSVVLSALQNARKVEEERADEKEKLYYSSMKLNYLHTGLGSTLNQIANEEEVSLQPDLYAEVQREYAAVDDVAAYTFDRSE